MYIAPVYCPGKAWLMRLVIKSDRSAIVFHYYGLCIYCMYCLYSLS